MKKQLIQITYTESNDLADFDSETQNLIKETRHFAKNAYAPYSKFRVSAALITEDGTLLKGTNVENASYPVGICAERTLISHCISNYPKGVIKCLAVYVDKDLEFPVPPCGMCRQTLLEAETRQNKNIQIILVGKNEHYIVFERCSDLLPLSFDERFLNL